MSVRSPVCRSITTERMPSNRRWTSSAPRLSPAWAKPVAKSTLRCLSKAALRSWCSFSETAADDTKTAQATQTAPEKRIV